MSELPVESALPALLAALRAGNSAVLQAPPGAGKTTLVPLALLDEVWLAGQSILMLEPRRLATRAAARRMASLRGEAVGETVGYRTRQDSRIGPRTRIEVVTEGILTRRMQDDPALEGVGIVIFDEFHERNLQADLGLALCLDARAGLREDLRLLAMSATLDTAAVARLLGDAPIVASEGRAYPVALHWLGPAPDERVLIGAVVRAIRRALDEESGSLLVFLPGSGEIRRVAALLERESLPKGVEVLPLYGNLPPEAQDRAIQPPASGTRKIVLATDIAETSLTIEGVRVVIDSGLRRRPRFDPRSGMTRLDTVRVSQASAEQRRGRAGRLEAGVCYRLWDEAAHARLRAHDAAEIQDADLAPLALELARWGESDANRLAWIDPPPAANLAQARDLLSRLGALDADGRISDGGRRMAALPLHPRLAHMLLAAPRAALTDACRLAALLEERDFLHDPPPDRRADLRLRLEALDALARDRHPAVAIHRGAAERIQQQAQRLARLVKGERDTATSDPEVAGRLLALAWPDRIAQKRSGGDNRYLLANGRGAFFRRPELIANCEYLVIAELDGDAREAGIFAAAPISERDLRQTCRDSIVTQDEIVWDAREQAVKARRRECLGALVLSESALTRPDPEAVTAALLAGIRDMGLARLPWERSSENLRRRLAFLRRNDPDGGWPDVSDDALLATLEDWLAPWLGGMSRRSHLARLNLHDCLRSLLDWEQAQALDRLAPTHLEVPSGSRIAIDYSADEPVLAVRLQEVFGLVETPRIGGGRVPVLMHLLSPAMRPVQVTRDLAGFWRGSYHEVKKEMKGRYPKHHWPDDPLQAEATRGTRRRRET
ncbi:MAG: ATP-dependent helicase HrpB [Chromatiales bacterium]|nr:ATP-dependent helicase HrpB [Chromatiales bacterium]MDX9767881.1 ATP-dependent helicase HrpB [Ectothiorhodospiraceae bacterium]